KFCGIDEVIEAVVATGDQVEGAGEGEGAEIGAHEVAREARALGLVAGDGEHRVGAVESDRDKTGAGERQGGRAGAAGEVERGARLAAVAGEERGEGEVDQGEAPLALALGIVVGGVGGVDLTLPPTPSLSSSAI